MRIKNNRLRDNARYFGVVLAVITLAFLIFSQYAYTVRGTDQSFSWLTGAITATVEESGAPQQPCTYQYVFIGNITSSTTYICVYQADGFRYGAVLQSGGVHRLAVGFSSDQRMYFTDVTYSGDLVWVPHSKHIVFRSPSYISNAPWYTYIIKDLPSKLTRYTSLPSGSYAYSIPPNSVEPLINDEDGEAVAGGWVAASDNGEWLSVIINSQNTGNLIRVNTQTFDKLLYANQQPVYGSTGGPEFAISNDGNRIAFLGVNPDPQIFEISTECGLEFSTFYKSWASDQEAVPIQTVCPSRGGIHQLVEDATGIP